MLMTRLVAGKAKNVLGSVHLLSLLAFCGEDDLTGSSCIVNMSLLYIVLIELVYMNTYMYIYGHPKVYKILVVQYINLRHDPAITRARVLS